MTESVFRFRAHKDSGHRFQQVLDSIDQVRAPLLIVAFLLVVWQWIAISGAVSPLILPAPTAVAAALIDTWPELWYHASFTALEAIAGFFVGNLLAIMSAVIFVQIEVVRRAVFPLSLGAQAIPVIATAPALVLLLGFGLAPRILVAASMVFFPTLVNMLRGLNSADAEVEDLMHSLSANWWQKLVKIRLPSSVPYLFAALVLAATSAFVGAVTAEWIGASRGIGRLIVQLGLAYRVPELWAAIFVGSAITGVFVLIVVGVQRRATSWMPDKDMG